MNEDMARPRTRTSWSETHLEKLYLALNRDYPDGRIHEIVTDLTRRGAALSYLLEQVRCECGAVGAARLSRLVQRCS